MTLLIIQCDSNYQSELFKHTKHYISLKPFHEMNMDAEMHIKMLITIVATAMLVYE